MPVVFVDPRPPALPTVEPYGLRLAAHDPGAPVLGLLANGFPDSEAFLAAVGDALARTVPGAQFRAVTKPSPPTPLTDEQLAVLVACDGVVAAYGH
jgi:hypothetical protein